MFQRTAITTTLAVCLLVQPAAAHWCNNIWTAPARLVVKPEKSTVHISGGAPATLRVYVRNNFPYKLVDLQLRGAASGYTVTVAPPGHSAQPAQDVSYVLTIAPSGGGGGDVSVSSLNLQVRFRGGGSPYGWMGGGDCRVDESPSLALLTARSEYEQTGSNDDCGPNQSAALSAATLADLYPSATLGSGAPLFGRSGLEQLIHRFGYRFCYDAWGGWRCGGQDCPTAACGEGSAWSSIEQFPQDCMRAGIELAARKTKLGSRLQAARDAAINALQGGGMEHRCLAAVVGGYLWQGASTASTFASALSGSGISTACQNAGRRVLDGSNGSSCGSGAAHERAACAAAEGLRGNDTPVRNVLMQSSGDGETGGGYTGLYHAYMLHLVAAHRRESTGAVAFYPDAGGSTAPFPDTGGPPRDQGGPPPPGDGGTTGRDVSSPAGDAFVPRQDGSPPVTSDAATTGLRNRLDGGCSVAAWSMTGCAAPALLLLLLAALLLRRR